ncbi:unnamed protein product [Allacma fusca]|uniref:CRAL-TRIO domain-containing protein n=1 Tax=Allacma fusca TaxID=39272 RepID=A0A8J2KEE9_9HEXA|nr:unnamed protein product [Allacma fusca]
MTAPTAEELAKLSQFRTRVGKIYPEPDEKLLSWLRARDLDLTKAEQMLRRHLFWRKKNEIDNIKIWRSPKVYFPYIQFGFDKENCPVFLMPVGRWDIRSAIEAGDFVPALRFIYQINEAIVSSISKTGVSQSTIIMDFDGFGYRQIAHRTVIQGMLEVLQVFEANYPEILKATYVINAPRTFNYLFALAKPLLNSRTLAKVQIFGPNRANWQTVILRHIDGDQIPPFWGGTRPGRDDFCSDDWFMEPLPPNFFKRKESTYDEYGEEWSTIKVPAREKVLFEYIMKPGDTNILSWTFKTEGYDVGFAIFYGEEEDYPVKYNRVNSHEKIQDGFLKINRPGKYTLEFDNTYSRSRSKNLLYRIEVRQFQGSDQNFNEINLHEIDT